jgi:hypothetical protein
VRRRPATLIVAALAAISSLSLVQASPAVAAVPQCQRPAVLTKTLASQATLSNVQPGRHDSEGFDRVVFTLDKASGYDVHYVSSVIKDPSGLPLPLAGKAFLQITFPQAHTTPTTPRDITTPAYQQLREVALAGDFEGVVTYGIGVAGTTDFRVISLTGPNRVVLDVALPGRHPWTCSGR